MGTPRERLCSARRASGLRSSSLPWACRGADPVGLWGYGGGLASACGPRRCAQYAPELNVRGFRVGLSVSGPRGSRPPPQWDGLVWMQTMGFSRRRGRYSPTRHARSMHASLRRVARRWPRRDQV
ncbi:hypothetical protein GS439_17480 [Rhodococcus hoagii]|nr:hypothetical protein [Prescottella equi]